MNKISTRIKSNHEYKIEDITLGDDNHNNIKNLDLSCMVNEVEHS